LCTHPAPRYGMKYHINYIIAKQRCRAAVKKVTILPAANAYTIIIYRPRRSS